MQRPIKFRACDLDKKYMSKPFELLDAAYEGFPRPITDDNGECDTSANVEVIQFTNLLDKNGKEMYEGDILRLDSWDKPQQVKFIEGAFCLADKHGDFTGDIHYIHHAGIPQATVIGNIYENP
jgi:hypothetical protein